MKCNWCYFKYQEMVKEKLNLKNIFLRNHNFKHWISISLNLFFGFIYKWINSKVDAVSISCCSKMYNLHEWRISAFVCFFLVPNSLMSGQATGRCVCVCVFYQFTIFRLITLFILYTKCQNSYRTDIIIYFSDEILSTLGKLNPKQLAIMKEILYNQDEVSDRLVISISDVLVIKIGLSFIHI